MIKTILCVEDDRFIGEMYVRSLQKAGRGWLTAMTAWWRRVISILT